MGYEPRSRLSVRIIYRVPAVVHARGLHGPVAILEGAICLYESVFKGYWPARLRFLSSRERGCHALLSLRNRFAFSSHETSFRLIRLFLPFL